MWRLETSSYAEEQVTAAGDELSPKEVMEGVQLLQSWGRSCRLSRSRMNEDLYAARVMTLAMLVPNSACMNEDQGTQRKYLRERFIAGPRLRRQES